MEYSKLNWGNKRQQFIKTEVYSWKQKKNELSSHMAFDIVLQSRVLNDNSETNRETHLKSDSRIIQFTHICALQGFSTKAPELS